MLFTQLRRLACTSVFLACATAIVVFAYPAPVGHANERVIEQASDIQVRDWNSGVTGMMPRYSGEDVTNTVRTPFSCFPIVHDVTYIPRQYAVRALVHRRTGSQGPKETNFEHL